MNFVAGVAHAKLGFIKGAAFAQSMRIYVFSKGVPFQGHPQENISAIGVGICVPSALDAIGVEPATIGVET